MSKVIFSDECKHDLHPDKRQYVRSNTSERFKQKYITLSHKFSPSIMIFGAIREDGERFLSLCSSNLDSNCYKDINKIYKIKCYGF